MFEVVSRCVRIVYSILECVGGEEMVRYLPYCSEYMVRYLTINEERVGRRNAFTDKSAEI